LLGNDGQPMNLDLGTGPASRFQFTLPPLGRRTMRSNVSSPAITTGWAMGACSIPVQATVLFRAIENGIASVEISAAATPATALYRSAANGDLGIAVANVFANRPVALTITAYDNDGRQAGWRALSLCGLCHTSFTLRSFLTLLPPGFEGSIAITSDHPSDTFAAWTLNADRGLLSSLPVGALEWPVSHSDRIWLVYQKLRHAAVLLFPNVDQSQIRLEISGERVLNAFARSDGLIQINLALAQLIGDSPSELAFIIGHELAHAIQFRLGNPVVFPLNTEIDADIIGMVLALVAGYDPYGGAGALGKLMMATQRTGLLAQFFDNLVDPHTSFSNRMGIMFEMLTLACAQPSARSSCAQYRNLLHPNFPDGMPLSIPDNKLQQ
jgi:hypothetical protein